MRAAEDRANSAQVFFYCSLLPPRAGRNTARDNHTDHGWLVPGTLPPPAMPLFIAGSLQQTARGLKPTRGNEGSRKDEGCTRVQCEGSGLYKHEGCSREG